jgi:hypothetical protein
MRPPQGNRIAIVSLSRNNPEELYETVRSVQLQSVAPEQHIVLDGSDASQAKLMREVAEAAGAEYHWTQPNGIYPAMHYSLTLPDSPDYLWWVNSSDRLSGRHSVLLAKKAINQAQARGTGHWVVGQLLRVKAGRQSLHRIGASGENFASLLEQGYTGVPHPSTLFHADSLDSKRAYLGSRRIAEDYALALTFLARYGAPFVTNEPLAVHQLNGFSYRHPVRNILEKIQARRVLSPNWSVIRESRVLLSTLPAGFFDRISGFSFRRQSDDWTDRYEWNSLHFCEPGDESQWPSCCDPIIGGLKNGIS